MICKWNHYRRFPFILIRTVYQVRPMSSDYDSFNCCRSPLRRRLGFRTQTRETRYRWEKRCLREEKNVYKGRLILPYSTGLNKSSSTKLFIQTFTSTWYLLLSSKLLLKNMTSSSAEVQAISFNRFFWVSLWFSPCVLYRRDSWQHGRRPFGRITERFSARHWSWEIVCHFHNSSLFSKPNSIFFNSPYGVKAISTPALATSLVESEYDWQYQATLVDRPDFKRVENAVTRGKVLGGSSSLNYYSWHRGTAAQYNEWELYGGKTWNWEACKPYFSKVLYDMIRFVFITAGC